MAILDFLRSNRDTVLCQSIRQVVSNAGAVPQRWFAENTANLNASEREGKLAYWHIPITMLDDGGLAINSTRVGRRYPLEPHRFPLGPRA